MFDVARKSVNANFVVIVFTGSPSHNRDQFYLSRFYIDSTLDTNLDETENPKNMLGIFRHSERIDCDLRRSDTRIA